MPILRELQDYADANGNTVSVNGEIDSRLSDITINFRGKNCHLVIEEGVVFRGGIQFLQDGGRVHVGQKSVIKGGFQVGMGSSISIGRNLDVTNGLAIVVDDGKSVTIGDDCLFAAGVNLRAYDNHPIFDLKDGKRINHSRSITIGSRVWLGFDVAALGGAKIPEGCIIGFRSIVTSSSKLLPYCLAVGQPARIVRKYVTFEKNGNPPRDSIDHSAFPSESSLYGPDAKASVRKSTWMEGLRATIGRPIRALDNLINK